MYESLYSDIGLTILGLAVSSNFQGKGIEKKTDGFCWRICFKQ